MVSIALSEDLRRFVDIYRQTEELIKTVPCEFSLTFCRCFHYGEVQQLSNYGTLYGTNKSTRWILHLLIHRCVA